VTDGPGGGGPADLPEPTDGPAAPGGGRVSEQLRAAARRETALCLRALDERPDLTADELAQRMGLRDAHQARRVLDRLLDLGLVCRAPADDDEQPARWRITLVGSLVLGAIRDERFPREPG